MKLDTNKINEFLSNKRFRDFNWPILVERWRQDIVLTLHNLCISVHISDLILSIIYQESSGNPKAVSSSGAVGLMQLMEAAAKDVEVKDRYNPQENIRGGITYFLWLVDKFKDLPKALQAYNAGPGNVEKGKIPEHSKEYANKILGRIQ